MSGGRLACPASTVGRVTIATGTDAAVIVPEVKGEVVGRPG
jgi:hypothetical protein